MANKSFGWLEQQPAAPAWLYDGQMVLLALGERVEVLPRCSAEQAVPTVTTLSMMRAEMMVVMLPSEPEPDLPTMRVVEESQADSAMMHLEMFFVLAEPEAYYVGVILSTMRVVEH